ncbi:MAG TPA: GNAT family N-acetyltransferase, partial [Devosia sp.]|nr:GNAT family N-acetyltransferase [Devosia sp.]
MAHGAAQVLELGKADDAADIAGDAPFTVAIGHSLDAVEPIWRTLAANGIESPGQSVDFIRLWVGALKIPAADQVYAVASEGQAPVALIALQRRWDKGARVLSWFPGAHVGCNAPVVDVARLRAMSPETRRRLWIALLRGIPSADLVYLKSVPQLLVDGVDLFAELGQFIAADTLYRAAFSSFEEADRTQRNKSRRKHDRQQGEKLEAMGTVTFEALDNGAAAVSALDVMFRQRAARFREMGVVDPFAVPAIRRFYDAT